MPDDQAPRPDITISRTEYEGMRRAAKPSVWDKVGDLAGKVAIPVSIVAGGAIINHEVRIARIEENRFTLADAKELRRELLEESPMYQAIRQLQRDLADLRKSIEGRLDRLESR